MLNLHPSISFVLSVDAGEKVDGTPLRGARRATRNATATVLKALFSCLCLASFRYHALNGFSRSAVGFLVGVLVGLLVGALLGVLLGVLS